MQTGTAEIGFLLKFQDKKKQKLVIGFAKKRTFHNKIWSSVYLIWVSLKCLALRNVTQTWTLAPPKSQNQTTKRWTLTCTLQSCLLERSDPELKVWSEIFFFFSFITTISWRAFFFIWQLFSSTFMFCSLLSVLYLQCYCWLILMLLLASWLTGNVLQRNDPVEKRTKQLLWVSINASF